MNKIKTVMEKIEIGVWEQKSWSYWFAWAIYISNQTHRLSFSYIDNTAKRKGRERERRKETWSGVCQCQRLNCMLTSMDPSETPHFCNFLLFYLISIYFFFLLSLRMHNLNLITIIVVVFPENSRRVWLERVS